MSELFAPVVTVSAHYSKRGIIDAARRGVSVTRINTVSVEPESDDWNVFFRLDPGSLQAIEENGGNFNFDSDSITSEISLTVGRPIHVMIDNKRPVPREIFLEVWRRPSLKVIFDYDADPVELDEFMSTTELLEFERARQDTAFGEHSRMGGTFHSVLENWRTWMTDEGLTLGQTMAKEVQNDLKEVAIIGHDDQEIRLALDQLELTLQVFEVNSENVGDNDLDALTRAIVHMDNVRSVVAPKLGERRRRRAEIDDASAWIPTFGSSRLRKALDARMLEASLGIYRDERLAVERPGWFWTTSSDEIKGIVNPSEESFDALLLVKLFDPAARLQFHTIEKVPVITSFFMGKRIYVPVLNLLDKRHTEEGG
jgi:hypothetical protein